jgi:hypothetical protein
MSLQHSWDKETYLNLYVKIHISKIFDAVLKAVRNNFVVKAGECLEVTGRRKNEKGIGRG